ncbi:MAG: hypothetical protein LBE22_08720 [Azoarcus sp.]|nr:hypothetical protein [Azoarcus sp.]
MDKKSFSLILFTIVGIAIFFLSIYAMFKIWNYFSYETKAEKELWIAEDGLLLADDAHFFPATGTIVVEKNEACIPLRTIHEKDFDYTEILCENNRGWVIGSDNFKVIRPTKENER